MAGTATAPLEVPEISRDEIRRRLRDRSLVILDVRPREAFAEGHIPGALSLPLADIPARASEALRNRAAEIAVYCASFT